VEKSQKAGGFLKGSFFLLLFLAAFVLFLYLRFGAFLPLKLQAGGSMPKEDKKRSVLEHAAAKTTPYEKMAPSASPTPPPSPGAEERAQEEWILAKQADLQKNIGKMQASVLAAQQTLQDLQPIFVDSSSEDSDAESDSEKSTEY
jgi:hypothetical protein